VIGGFLGENSGWVWVQGFLATFAGVIWAVEGLVIPETYGPLLLRKRAARLSNLTGKVYISKIDSERPKVTNSEAFSTALGRPWLLLFAEPIVLLLSIYMAIIYGTLYLMFGAFPIVYQEQRGWSQGVASLPFLSVLTGMLLALVYNIWDNQRYKRIHVKCRGFAPPEERLPPSMIGGIAVPIGLFWFAWTNQASLHWIFSVVAAAPFGFGMVLVFLSIMSYLVDSYTIFAASALAANSIIRSCLGAVFPLFTTYMYHNLGIHWASCVPAFLSLACVPFPFLFYRYGPAIRRRCKFAAEADDFMRMLQKEAFTAAPAENAAPESNVGAEAEEGYIQDQSHSAGSTSLNEPRRLSSESLVLDPVVTYEGNPYDIDRVNTRSSAITNKSKSRSIKTWHKK
jgi:hypothetical protein